VVGTLHKAEMPYSQMRGGAPGWLHLIQHSSDHILCIGHALAVLNHVLCTTMPNPDITLSVHSMPVFWKSNDF
jgi:hypothetical protein